MGWDRLARSLGLTAPTVFISYRRVDSGGHSAQLFERLSRYYGRGTLSLDHEVIRGGDDFAERLESALEQAEVVLAVIGPDWCGVQPDGTRRIDDPRDWVHREIAVGLAEELRVIPVLVGEADMPDEASLPPPLRPLVTRQYRVIRPDRFADDVRFLIRTIGGRRRPLGIPLLIWLLCGLLLLVGVFLVAARLDDPSNTAPFVETPAAFDADAGAELRIDTTGWATDDHDDDLRWTMPSRSELGAEVGFEGETITYAAPSGTRGTDTFDVTVTDSEGSSTTVSVFVEVRLGAMDGAFNVGVAEFSAVDASSDATTAISDAVFDGVSASLAAQDSLDVEIAGPNDVGVVDGSDADSREAAAFEVAERLRADVVVYGSLRTVGNVSDFVADLLISDRNVQYAEELVGAHELLRLEIPSADPVTLQSEITDRLDPLGASLGDLVVGLRHYSTFDFESALASFERAESQWIGDSGRPVVLQLLGNTKGALGDLDGAGAAYAEAVDIDPEYARAHFGLAEVAFQAACGGSVVDNDGLRAASQEFLAIAELEAPPESFLPLRSRLGAERATLCRSDLATDGYESVQRSLSQLTDEVAALSPETEPKLRELASEAHQLNGFVSFTLGEDEDALVEYAAAADLTFDDSRRAFFHLMRATVYECRMGDLESARREFAIAVDLFPDTTAVDCTGL